MEIERKFLIKHLPEHLDTFPHQEIWQGYLCTEPVVRIRQLDHQYILTYKSTGMRSRIEEEMPLTKEAFAHLIKKCDGNAIHKTRYRIPDTRQGLTIELDIFHDTFNGIYLAEVEFPDETTADTYEGPEWFGTDVTYDGHFHNSRLSQMSQEECKATILFSKKDQ